MRSEYESESLDIALRHILSDVTITPDRLKFRTLQKVMTVQREARFRQLSLLAVLSSILATLQVIVVFFVFMEYPIVGMLAIWGVLTEITAIFCFGYVSYTKLLPEDKKNSFKKLINLI